MTGAPVYTCAMARRSSGAPAPRLPPWALIAIALVAIIGLALSQRDRLGGGGGGGDGGASHERLPHPHAPAPPLPAPPPPPPGDRAAPTTPPASRLDVAGIGDADERAAIVAIARAIDRGGPFAYRKDGVVFENREHRLAAQPRGHWREYTVPTPGESDRGARRIIAGKDGELFYTRDHYRTFHRIRGPTSRTRTK